MITQHSQNHFTENQHTVDKKDFFFEDFKHDVCVAGIWTGEVGNNLCLCFFIRGYNFVKFTFANGKTYGTTTSHNQCIQV